MQENTYIEMLKERIALVESEHNHLLKLLHIALSKPKILDTEDKVTYVASLLPDRNTKLSKGDLAILILKSYLKRATSKSVLEWTYNELYGDFGSPVDLKEALRNKVRQGELRKYVVNNSRKYSYYILPEWIEEDLLLNQYKPDNKLTPNLIRTEEIE